MQLLMAAAFLLSLQGSRAYAIGEVIYTCSAADGVGFIYPLRRGTSNPNLIVTTASTRNAYSAEQYETAILEGDLFNPDHLLILDTQGNRLIEKKDGKLIGADGEEHDLFGCSVDA